MKLTLEDVQKKIAEVGDFSPKLCEVLLYILKDLQDVRSHFEQENENRKAELAVKVKESNDRLENESKRLKDILKRENEERQRELKDLEIFAKRENAERKRETEEINAALSVENEKRIKEAQALKEKMEKENKEMQAYLERDAREMKAKIEAENKALQDKLDKEASALKDKLTEGEESRRKETKALQDKLEKEKEALAKQMESGSKELSEKMAREEELRKKEAQEMKDRLETEKRQQGNAFTEMFDRLKAENEQRKVEVHGLKDILVRENDNRVRETEELRIAMELSSQKLGEALERECYDMDQKIKHLAEDVTETLKIDKKEILAKLEGQGSELKRKIEVETNEIRDKIQLDKKMLSAKLDEDAEDRHKEISLLKNHIQKEREEIRGQLESDTKMVLDQLSKDSNDIINLIKKEKSERERDSNLIKERIDNERKELQISIDKDRDNMTKRLNEEHDQRRLEQKELVQRLDNNEQTGKGEILDLFTKLKREQESRELDMDEVRQTLKHDKNMFDEKLHKEKQALRESLTTESLELNKRVDKLNSERMTDVADIQAKMSLIGKSASRHLDNLRQSLYRDCQNLFELATKPCSIVFNAFREDSYMDGGEDYLTFSGCTVNIGNAMNPKSGEFKVPEAGLYLFLVTCCTFDMKKCLLSIRKNGKDVANIFDQDGMENRGRTMIGQNVLLELVEGDKVQVYVNTASGLFDHKNSHYTQFIGAMLRPSVETLAAAMRKLGNADDDDLGDESVRSIRPGMNNGGDTNNIGAKRNQRGGSRNRMLSPPPGTINNSNGSVEQTKLELQGDSQPQNLDDHSTVVQEKKSSVTKLDEEVAVYQPNGVQPDEDEVEVDGKEGDKASGEKPQQSYLALTKLGMGKKSSKEKVPGQQTEQTPKDKSVNGFGKGARKSITEMASATLMKAGLTKS